MERATAAFQGRTIKTIGDEAMAVFDTAEGAALAAGEMQRRIDVLPPVSGIKLAIRIGMHHGPVLEENGDVFGDTVNTAARLVALAKAGQILASVEVVAHLSPALRAATREIDMLAVRGKDEGVHAFEVIWQESDDLTMRSERAAPVESRVLRLRLRHGSAEIVLGPERPAALLGRDIHCDVVIRDTRASRSHARIEHRRDKFVLVDQSTNGTYVTLQGEAEFVLKREEVILRGRGRIAFGHTRREAGLEILEFDILGA
jgi:hypothetical protein